VNKKYFTRGGFVLADAVRNLYRSGQSDYTLEPVVSVDSEGNPIGRIRDGDAVVFCCRRGEREIQLTEAFVEKDFDHFKVLKFHHLLFVILTLYHEKFKSLPVAFAPTQLIDTLGEAVSQANLRQLRVAESEKFAHVTFFLNGGNNQPFRGEEDVRVASPQKMLYDQTPELSLAQVTEQVTHGIHKGYDLIVTNFANGDVIGHTQNCEAKIRCAEIVDEYLGKVVNSALTAGYAILVTADHGNLEEMTHADGSVHVSHTANPVPFVLIDAIGKRQADLLPGTLTDIAPTVLMALGIKQPASMKGSSLVPFYNWGGRRRVLLLILDGWGIGKDDETNPIHLAHTPVWDNLLQQFPSTQLQAAGEAVGLQTGKAGNSEAGHMNIGAGHVVLQDDARLDQAMRNGTFADNEVLCQAIREVNKRNTRLHLIGLLSEKSSHGCIGYPLEILRMAKKQGIENVYLHIIFDGRSTEPGSAPVMLEQLEYRLEEIGLGQIVSGFGRGIALDRNGNYGKTKLAYDALVYGHGQKFSAAR
jgi:2,3-bisphosphoglycerate-independent phosphoglycerate mutase